MKYPTLIGLALITIACSEQAEDKIDSTSEVPTFEIKPLIENAEPTAEIFEIDNSKDTILISEHGSFIRIPADCFENKSGEAITEGVKISFTEFSDVSDIVLSGIPMQMMQGEDTMTFQSAGMCDIKAEASGNELSLKSGKTIDLGLRNTAQDPDYNLYFFDEQKGEWIKKRDSVDVDPTPLPLKPVNLATADSTRIVKIVVANSAVRPTYSMWHQSKFYLRKGQRLKYAKRKVFWYDMDIKATANPDEYVLVIYGTGNNRQYREAVLVQPTISEENYESEMARFENNMRQYALGLLAYEQDLEESRIQGLELMAQLEKQWLADSAAAAEQYVIDSLRWEKEAAQMALNTEVMRTFEIAQMGIYNCDRFYKSPIIAERNYTFTHDGSVMDFSSAKLLCTSDNAVLNWVPRSGKAYQLKFASGKYHFVGTKDGELYCAPVDGKSWAPKNVSQEIERIQPDDLKAIVNRW